MPYFTNRGIVPLSSGGSGLDTATDAWIAAVGAAGGTVSPTQQARVDALIVGLKADGIFALTDGLWLWAGESDIYQAKIDIVHLGVGTVVSLGALAAGGYSGGGYSGGFDTPIVPSAGGLNYALNTCALGVYQRTSVDDGVANCGVSSSGTSTRLQPFNATVLRVVLNGASADDFTMASNNTGMWIGRRLSASVTQGYRNGSPIGSAGTASSVSLPTNAISFFGQNDGGGTHTNGTSDQLAAGWVGNLTSDAMAANLTTRVETYMDAWGVGVI